MTEEQQKALQEKIKNMSPEELRQFQKQQCVFCQIIAGKIPAKKMYEDQYTIGIMDINPATKGHILLVPKEHYAIMPQVPDKEIGHCFVVAKYLSQLLLKVLKVSGTNVFIANGAAAGQKSQHFLLHVIPRKDGDKIMDWEEKVLDANTREKVRQAIELRLNDLLGVKPKTARVQEKKTSEKKHEKMPEPEAVSAENTETAEEQEEQPDSQQKSGDDKISLDDIANLFK